MVIYLALLRAVNVGGKNKIGMAKLKETFEQLGFSNVKTYIASANVVFCSNSKSQAKLTKQIEAAIKRHFKTDIRVLLRDLKSIAKLVKALPASWANDLDTKCDVMFLWKEQDKPSILKELPFDPKIEDVRYLPGSVAWRIDRDKISKSRMFKIVGTKLHKQLTVRNPNTVRKIYQIMLETEK